MKLALLLAQQVFTMLLYTLTGFAACRKGIVTPEQSKGMSSMMLYILCPCMLLKAFKMEYDPQKLLGLGLSLAGGAIAIFFMMALGRFLFFRKNTPEAPIERGCICYTNAGNLTIPLIAATLGQESVFYSCGYLIVSTTLLWTAGLYQVSGDRSRIRLKNIVTNTSMLAMAVGLIFFRFSIRLPAILDNAVSGFSNMVGPVTMFVIGVMLGSQDLKKILTNRRAYWVCFLRLVVTPLAVILLFRLINIIHWFDGAAIPVTVVVISSSAPVAALMSVFSQQFDKDTDYVSQVTSLSTILCIFTMPTMLFLAQQILV